MNYKYQFFSSTSTFQQPAYLNRCLLLQHYTVPFTNSYQHYSESKSTLIIEKRKRISTIYKFNTLYQKGKTLDICSAIMMDSDSNNFLNMWGDIRRWDEERDLKCFMPLTHYTTENKWEVRIVWSSIVPIQVGKDFLIHIGSYFDHKNVIVIM